jgi:hypothetical protein
MSRKMSSTNVLTLWHGGDDLPPATAAKIAKPKKVLNLSERFAETYKAPRRIGATA